MERYAIGVIGGGIVGICCALSLQRERHEVVLFERNEIGSGASFGNAGIMSSGGCVPVAMPGTLRKVPRMLFETNGPLAVRWRYLPNITPWLMRCVAASSPGRVEEISLALSGLLSEAQSAYRELLSERDDRQLIVARGLLFPYKSRQAFAAASAARDLRQRRGVSFEILDSQQLQKLEPALSKDHEIGVFFPDTRHCVDPLQLTQRLAEKFVEEGGSVVQQEVRDIALKGDRPGVISAKGNTQFDKVVVAAGAWSRVLARSAGVRVPLDTERGYHAMLPSPRLQLQVPLISGDHSIAITPMTRGLRVSGTVEFAGLRAPPDYSRAEKLIGLAQRVLPDLQREDATFWMGFRPSMPDSLPVIGFGPKSRNILLAFGHGHQGMGQAAVTARIIADLVANRSPRIDISAFAPDRFRARSRTARQLIGFSEHQDSSV